MAWVNGSSKTSTAAVTAIREQPGNGRPPGLLHPAWAAFVRYCQQLGHGEIEKLKIQDGLPVAAAKHHNSLALLILLALFSASSSMATTCIVTSIDDTDASNPTGTLRWAVGQANAGACDTINFSLSYPATITLAQGQLEISNNATITGPGADKLAITGNNASRIFQVDAGTDTSIAGVTVENGKGTDGGGIANAGQLTVTGVTFSNNSAYDDGTGTGHGGAISTPVAYSGSSGSTNQVTTIVNRCTFSHNTSPYQGGAIFNEYGSLIVQDSTFSGNSGGEGGGISSIVGLSLQVSSSTFASNSALYTGAGLESSSDASSSVTNSTFYGNAITYYSGYGAAISDRSNNMKVTSTTIAGNSAPYGGSAIFFDAENPNGGSSYSLTLKNTILSGTCLGTAQSLGYNLYEDSHCLPPSTGDNLVAAGAEGLDPNGLQNNGGPTKTIALQSSSPAVDAIPVSPANYCTDAAGNAITTDQRGVTRPQGSACDIGAFELGPRPPTTVTSLADDGSLGTLRYAIANANSGDTITFNVTGTITLAQGQLEINKDLTISGPGAPTLAISGDNTYQVFLVDSGATVSISGVTIENGNGTSSGGGISNSGTLVVTGVTFWHDTNGGGYPFPITGDGGGIANYGTAAVSGSTFSIPLHACINGCGILNNGTLTVTNTSFIAIDPTSGPVGNSNGGGVSNSGSLTLANSTFSNLGTGGGGGGIFNSPTGNFTIVNSTFSGDGANVGGGILNNGTGTISNSTFFGNSAVQGGGFYNLNATMSIKGTLLSANGGGNCYKNGGSFVSEEYNLSDDNSCSAFFTGAGDLNNTPAQLDPNGLQDYGGPTRTIALQSTSRAVDAIPVASCTDAAGNAITTDQRGVTRPKGAACDIGAYELDRIATLPTVTASVNPSTYGQLVTYTAMVASTGGTPSGTVTFYDRTTAIGTGSLDGAGHTTVYTATLTAGTHTITATYSGDKTFASSTSSAVSQSVGKAGTTTSLTSSPNPSTQGQTVNFVATVTGQYGGLATGTVTFKDGTKTVLGTASLINGSSILPSSSLGTGSHTVTAMYGGDANSNGSTSAAITQTVAGKTATATAVSSSLNPSFVGQSVTFTATVSPSAATGTVTFKAGQTVLGTGSLSSGTATFGTSSLSAGSFNIVAVYGGDVQFASSTSGSLTQTVNKASTTTALGSSPNPSSVGQLITFTATVTSSIGATPSGTVTFKEGTTTLGTGTLDGTGAATLSTSTLSKGKHNVKAVYGATSAFVGSTSAVITQVVQ